MSDKKKKLIRDFYKRVCVDSRFRVDPIEAARLTAAVAKVHPLEVWLVLGTDNMSRIADGTHPAVSKAEPMTEGGE